MEYREATMRSNGGQPLQSLLPTLDAVGSGSIKLQRGLHC